MTQPLGARPAVPYLNPAMVMKEERTWASVCHLGALAFILLPFLGHILGPLAVWLVKRQESPFVDEHGRAALNFQFSVSIYGFVFFLIVILVGVQNTLWGFVTAFVLFFPLKLFWLICIVVGTIHATDGELYRYPLSFRFL